MVYQERIQSNQPATTTVAFRNNILLLPGLHDSPALHWQSHWQNLFGFSRVAFDDWNSPTLHGWIRSLEEAVRLVPQQAVIVGHSLGCLAAVWWARSSLLVRKVAGALLVGRLTLTSWIALRCCATSGRYLTRHCLFLQCSQPVETDPYADFESSERMARSWASHLIDCGDAGHINADSGLGCWTEGLHLLLGLIEGKDGSAAVRNWLLSSAV